MLYGDFGESALEVVEAVSREVMLPLLSGPAEQANLSPLLGRQIMEDLRAFVANGVTFSTLVLLPTARQPLNCLAGFHCSGSGAGKQQGPDAAAFACWHASGQPGHGAGSARQEAGQRTGDAARGNPCLLDAPNQARSAS